MNDNIKSSVGMLVPLSSLVLFLYFSLLGNFLGAVLAAISGVMLWYLYSLVVESQMPDITGNVVVLFGSLLAIAFFLNYGISKNMFGGFNINLEGITGSAVVLFFSVLLGISLRKQPSVYVKPKSSDVPASPEPPVLDTSSVKTNDPADEASDSSSYYDPSQYEYPDYYDYEYDEDFDFYDDVE